MSDPKQPDDEHSDETKDGARPSDSVQDNHAPSAAEGSTNAVGVGADQENSSEKDAQQDGDASNWDAAAAMGAEQGVSASEKLDPLEIGPRADQIVSGASAGDEVLREKTSTADFDGAPDAPASAPASARASDEDEPQERGVVDENLTSETLRAGEGDEASGAPEGPHLAPATRMRDDEASHALAPPESDAAVAETADIEDEASLASDTPATTEATELYADAGTDALTATAVDETSADTVPVADVFGVAAEDPAATAVTEPDADDGSVPSADIETDVEELAEFTVPVEDVFGAASEPSSGKATRELGADDDPDAATANVDEPSKGEALVLGISGLAADDDAENASTEPLADVGPEAPATSEDGEPSDQVVLVADEIDVLAQDLTNPYATDESQTTSAAAAPEDEHASDPIASVPDQFDAATDDRARTGATENGADGDADAPTEIDVDDVPEKSFPVQDELDVAEEDPTETISTETRLELSSTAPAKVDVDEASDQTAHAEDERDVSTMADLTTTAAPEPFAEEREEPSRDEYAAQQHDARPFPADDEFEFSTPRDALPDSGAAGEASPQPADPLDQTPPAEPAAIEEDAAASGGADKIAIAIKAAEEAVRSEGETARATASAEEAAAWEAAWREAEEAKEAEKRAATAERAQRNAAFFSTANAFAPFAIAAYCLALAALRLSFSPFLEVDESEFVGRVDFRLIYDNAHPPLFNWAMRILLSLTSWSWADAVAILRYALLGGFHYLTWATATRVAGPRAGIAALAVSALCPQIVWMSTHTLAHSIMTLCATAAVLFCTLRALKKPGWRSYAWLGLAMSLGALAKFNFFLLLVPFFAAFAMDREGRRLFTQPFAWIAPAVFLATSAPSLIAAAIYTEDSASRIEKLYRSNQYSFLDLPYVGVDGFISLIVMTIAWAGIAGAIWLGARAYDRRYGVMAEPSAESVDRAPYSAVMLGRILERIILLGLALFALLILAGDVTKIEERYLTPLLALLPVYLALRWPLSLSARPVALLAIAAYVAVFPGFWGYVTHGKHRFAVPYDSVAAQIRRQYPESLPLLALRHDDRANMVLALNWPGAETPRYQEPGDQALLVWRGRGVAPKQLEPAGFGPASPVTTVAAAYRNSTDLEAVYSFQLYVRTGP